MIAPFRHVCEQTPMWLAAGGCHASQSPRTTLNIMSVCDNIMSTAAATIKISTKDSALIDRFVELGEFESRGEFVIFSIKKTINELLLKEFGEKAYSMAQLSDEDVNNLLTEIKNIRKGLWSEYAKRLS